MPTILTLISPASRCLASLPGVTSQLCGGQTMRQACHGRSVPRDSSTRLRLNLDATTRRFATPPETRPLNVASQRVRRANPGGTRRVRQLRSSPTFAGARRPDDTTLTPVKTWPPTSAPRPPSAPPGMATVPIKPEWLRPARTPTRLPIPGSSDPTTTHAVARTPTRTTCPGLARPSERRTVSACPIHPLPPTGPNCTTSAVPTGLSIPCPRPTCPLSATPARRSSPHTLDASCMAAPVHTTRRDRRSPATCHRAPARTTYLPCCIVHPTLQTSAPRSWPTTLDEPTPVSPCDSSLR